MEKNFFNTDRESPARRLQILYIASLFALALLSAVSQALIVKELASDSALWNAISRSVHQKSLARSMSFAALEISGEDDPVARRKLIASLQESIRHHEGDSLGSEVPATGPRPTSRPVSGVDWLFLRAEPYRRSAMRAGQELISALESVDAEAGSVSADRARIKGLARKVVAEEAAFHEAVKDAALQAQWQADDHLTRLKWLELELLGFVMVVLLLEGFFVISPAVRRIQRFTMELKRSHAELSDYAAKLEQSNKELQDFASVASHDLQEPLRKVQAFSDRLRTKCAGALDEQGRDYLDRVQNAARRMQTLINDLLTYARVTTKAQPFVPIDLTEATREVVADLEGRIEQVDGKVEVGELPTVDVDPLQVRQLMQNLIGNALKYHRPEVPPVVKISYKLLAQEDPTPPAVPLGERCQILVEDNGIGFDEVYTDRIFTIFQRLHGRTEYEGTGIGLAVCRKIAERHHGTITARSTPGAGSTFMVTLPVRQPKETSADERECKVDYNSGRGR